MMIFITILGAIVSFICGSFYLFDTIQGKVQPNRVTWLLWTISPLISTFASSSAGADWKPIVPVFMAGFMPLLVLIASFVNKSSYWSLSYLDYICGILSVLSLIVWYLSKDPNLAIVFSIFSDLMAAIPTFVKIWCSPESEASIYYIGGIFTDVSSLITATRWTIASVSFSIYLILLDISLLILIYYRKNHYSVSKQINI